MPSETERFQSFCRQYINRKVRERFKDLGGDDWQADFTNDRHFSRHVVTHKDDDPLALTVGRLIVYFFEIQGFLKEPLYTMPSRELHISNTIYPQVIICFRESTERAKAQDRNPLTATHAIRTQHDFSSKADVQRLAQKIKSIFATPVFNFDKGKLKYTYWEKAKGYNIIVTCPSEAEAKPIVERLLRINNDTPNWDYLNESKSNQNFEQQEQIRVNGETKKKPKRRQSGKVIFTHAELAIPGVAENIYLVDVSGQYPGAILYA
jgi:hypothetical protein